MKMHFDVRTKIVLLLMAGIGTFFVNTIVFEATLVLFFALFQWISGPHIVSWRLLLCYGVLIVMQYFLLPVLPAVLTMILSIPVVNFRKMFPCVMAFILLIRTTKVNEAIATMTKMHVPKAVTITFAVSLRYIPVLGEECRHIRDAMKIRQLSVRRLGLLNGTIKKVEGYVVPVLIAATKTAENLAAAALTRGIEHPGRGTCRGYQRLQWQDYCLIVLGFFIIVSTILYKMKGGW